MSKTLRFVPDPKGFPSSMCFNTVSEIIEAIEKSWKNELTYGFVELDGIPVMEVVGHGEVKTKRGVRYVLAGYVTEHFWETAWEPYKDALKTLGVQPQKNKSGEWCVIWWRRSSDDCFQLETGKPDRVGRLTFTNLIDKKEIIVIFKGERFFIDGDYESVLQVCADELNASLSAVEEELARRGLTAQEFIQELTNEIRTGTDYAVYVRGTAKKYHRRDCHVVLEKNKRRISFSEAQENYHPCSVCRPPYLG